ncbi:hypothetical protein BCR36DRAFT_371321 [Piromyces finnis]|uniref:Uncharacterized protein n=1 Tax=Piromyces finnis TaxID=1754191 RepID=A0A1Y1V6M0_9FUNG|nr:hypothetical protein BCR36DRAFT_371321 [Piromyces finnis]|eukprot:ORX48469.1 hypothetical protein BCR36DRAFT_371321 [Piromyces finnis]
MSNMRKYIVFLLIILLIFCSNIIYCGMATEGVLETYDVTLISSLRDENSEKMFEQQFKINDLVKSINGNVLNYKILKDGSNYKIYVPVQLIEINNDSNKKNVLLTI